jgi:hypothetical protein
MPAEGSVDHQDLAHVTAPPHFDRSAHVQGTRKSEPQYCVPARNHLNINAARWKTSLGCRTTPAGAIDVAAEALTCRQRQR